MLFLVCPPVCVAIAFFSDLRSWRLDFVALFTFPLHYAGPGGANSLAGQQAFHSWYVSAGLALAQSCPKLPTPSCLAHRPEKVARSWRAGSQPPEMWIHPDIGCPVSFGFYKRFVGVNFGNSAVLSVKSKPRARLGGTRKIDRLWLTNAVFVSTCTSKLLPDFVLMTLKNPNCKHTKHPKFVLKKRPYPTWQELRRGEFMPRSARGVGRPCFG